jgi:hypothetical protein
LGLFETLFFGIGAASIYVRIHVSRRRAAPAPQGAGRFRLQVDSTIGARLRLYTRVAQYWYIWCVLLLGIIFWSTGGAWTGGWGSPARSAPSPGSSPCIGCGDIGGFAMILVMRRYGWTGTDSGRGKASVCG